MATKLNRLETILRANRKGFGITAARLAKLANTTRTNVHKRIYDLRNIYERNLNIHSNFQTVNGRRKVYYRLGS